MDILGVQLETPQEIQARIQQTNQEVISRAGGNRAALRSATIQTGLNNVLGSIQSQRAAKDAEELAKSVSARVDALPDTANDEDKLEARLRGSLDFADSRGRTDDSLSLNKQLLQIETAKNERAKLQASEDLDLEIRQNNLREGQLRVEGLEKSKEFDEALGDNVSFIGGTVGNPVVRSFDLSTEAGQNGLEDFKANNPAFQELPPGGFAELVRQGAEDKEKEARTPRDQENLRKKAEGTIRVLGLANTIAEVFRGSPDVATATNSLLSGANSVANELSSARRQAEALISGDATAQEENRALLSRITDNAQIQGTRLEGLAIDAAFALANARDSGKLSDNDIDFGLRSIGFVNGKFVNNPRAALASINDTIVGSATEFLGELGRLQDPEGFDAHIEEINARITTFDGIFQSFDQGSEPTLSTEQLVDKNTNTATSFKASNGATVGFGR